MSTETNTNALVPEVKRVEKPESMHMMVDIETLSTAKNAMIIQVGAVLFDPFSEYIDQKHYIEMDMDIKLQEGRHIDPNTLIWWNNTNHKLFEKILSNPEAKSPLSLATNFDSIAATTKVVGFWANAPVFDLEILKSLYATHIRNHDVPWKYFQERCVRTAKDMGNISNDDVSKEMIRRGFTGDKHAARYDALVQSVLVQMAYKKLGLWKK